MPEDRDTRSDAQRDAERESQRDEPTDGGDSGSPFFDRVMRYLDNALDAAGVAELQQELASSDSKREAFALICFGEALAREALTPGASLGEPLGECLGDAPPDSEPGLSDAMVLPAIQPEPEEAEPLPPAMALPEPPATDNRRKWRRWGTAAAAAGVLVAGGLALLLHSPKPPPAVAEVVARVDSVAAARWEGGADLAPGAALNAGAELSLTAGCADLRFGDGADVILEAPARLKVESSTSLTLVSGKVVVRMPAGGIPAGGSGFAVRTASGTVTDLGTEFGVAVGSAAAAGGTEVDVFQGHVQVEPAGRGNSGANSVVAAGDAATVKGGAITVAAGAARPQAFVRTLAAVPSLDVVDLLCGGDGTTHRRGNQIDPTSGASGNLPAASERRGNESYHPVPPLLVVDGCFMPAPAGGPARTDSAGHAFTFPKTNGMTYLHIVAGGRIPVPPGRDPIGTVLGDVDYASPEHGLLLVHPNAGLTLDLSAVRRLHPGSRLTRFHCLLGYSHPKVKQNKADAYVLADGTARFERRQFTGNDGVSQVDVPIQEADRFLTLVTTDGGDGTASDDVLFADPTFDLTPAGGT